MTRCSVAGGAEVLVHAVGQRERGVARTPCLRNGCLVKWFDLAWLSRPFRTSFLNNRRQVGSSHWRI